MDTKIKELNTACKEILDKYLLPILKKKLNNLNKIPEARKILQIIYSENDINEAYLLVVHKYLKNTFDHSTIKRQPSPNKYNELVYCIEQLMYDPTINLLQYMDIIEKNNPKKEERLKEEIEKIKENIQVVYDIDTHKMNDFILAYDETTDLKMGLVRGESGESEEDKYLRTFFPELAELECNIQGKDNKSIVYRYLQGSYVFMSKFSNLPINKERNLTDTITIKNESGNEYIISDKSGKSKEYTKSFAPCYPFYNRLIYPSGITAVVKNITDRTNNERKSEKRSERNKKKTQITEIRLTDNITLIYQGDLIKDDKWQWEKADNWQIFFKTAVKIGETNYPHGVCLPFIDKRLMGIKVEHFVQMGKSQIALEKEIDNLSLPKLRDLAELLPLFIEMDETYLYAMGYLTTRLLEEKFEKGNVSYQLKEAEYQEKLKEVIALTKDKENRVDKPRERWLNVPTMRLMARLQSDDKSQKPKKEAKKEINEILETAKQQLNWEEIKYNLEVYLPSWLHTTKPTDMLKLMILLNTMDLQKTWKPLVFFNSWK